MPKRRLVTLLGGDKKFDGKLCMAFTGDSTLYIPFNFLGKCRFIEIYSESPHSPAVYVYTGRKLLDGDNLNSI